MATIPANNNTGLYNTSGTAATTGNDITVNGNVNGNNINAVNTVNAGTNVTAQGNISAGGYFIGDGSLLTNINAGNIVGSYGNANVATYLASGTNTANIVTTGNVSGTYILGNGSQLTGLPATYGNANVNAHLAAFGSNTISTTGNITGGYFIGNGSQLTGLPASYGNANVAAFLPTYTGNLAGGNAAITNDLVVGGTIFGTFSGNISGNLVVPGSNTEVLFNNAGNAGASSDFTFNDATNVLTVNGNVNATTFNGSGAGLTAIPGANVTGTVANATYATNAGTATTASQATVANSANSVAGGNVTGQVANALVAGTVYVAAQPNITSVGTLTSLSTSGNVDVGGSLNTDDITSTGNVTVFGNQVITGNLTVQGNTTTINSNTITTNDKTITVANNQSTGALVDGSGLEAGNPAVATWLYNNASNTWRSSIGISAVGNITGAFFVGNGSQLTGLPASYSDANVTTLLAAFGSNTIATSGNITGGNFIGSGSALTNLTGANVTGTVANATFATSAGTASVATTAFSVNAANVVGTVANAAYATNAGTATSATTAGTVTTNAQPNITSVGTLTSVAVTGNVTTGGILTDGYYYANGTPVSFGGGSSYGNANVVALLAAFGSNSISTTGNITTGLLRASNIGTSASRVDVGWFNALAASTSIVSSGSLDVGGNAIITGNISAAFFNGNGRGLTGLSTYGNSNVATFLNNFGSNAINTSGNIAGGNFNGGNAYVNYIESQGNIDGVNLNLSGSIYITASNFDIGIGTFIGGNANINGNIRGGNINTTGQVSVNSTITAGGNISGNYILGNGSALTGVVATSIGGNLTSDLNTNGYFIKNPGGDVLMGNVWVTGTFAANSISSPAGDFVQIEGITVTNGMVSSGNITAQNVFSNAAITAVTTISAIGNITSAANINGANINANGTIRSTGDTYVGGVLHVDNIVSDPGSFVSLDGVSAGLVYVQDRGNLLLFESASNGTNYTGFRAPATLAADYLYTLPTSFGSNAQVLTTDGAGNLTWTTASGGGSPGGANTQIQFNDGGAFAGNSALTFNNVSGNIGIANLIVNAQQIQTVAAAGIGSFANLVSNPGRVVLGTGYNGNISPAFDLLSNGRGARFLVGDSYNINDGNSVVRGVQVQNYFTLTANVTSANLRLAGGGFAVIVGGGAGANTVSGATSATGVSGTSGAVIIGGGTSGNLTGVGNTIAQYTTGVVSSTTVNAGSTGGNIFGTTSILTNNGTANTLVGFTPVLIGTGTYSNVYGYYMPGSATTHILGSSNTARNATNYYAIRNDDDVSQVKLGSLRLFHEFQYALTSSAGALTVDKNNGQVQFLTVSEAITSVSFSNFVTTASTGTTNKRQADTVTLIVQQDATGRSITLPAASSTYKYAGGSNTVPSTANSVSMISITAIYNTVTAADQYLITISPEFS